MGTPVIYTRITKTMAGFQNDKANACTPLEMDFHKCASRVGMERARVDCFTLYEDFKECTTQRKQIARTILMQQERKRQGKKADTVQDAFLFTNSEYK